MNSHLRTAFIRVAGLAVFLFMAGCGTSLPETTTSGRHLVPEAADISSDIPDVVGSLPLLTEPQPEETPELYTVVAQDVPVRELLFTMARDASINIDVHPQISGQVSLNAIDQTLPQILERLSRQVDLRWSFDANNNLMVEPDTPYWRSYRIDYVNVARTSSTTADVSTSIVSVGGTDGTDSNNSSATLNQSSTNNFWATLTANLTALIGEGAGTAGGAGTASSSIVVNPESGIVSIRATSTEHGQIQSFLNFVQTRSLYQVLIEATVVEVNLNDRFQSGVDWATIGRDSGTISFAQSVTGANLASAPTNILTIDRSSGPDAIAATLRLLSQFGDLRVLSSPKIMALNNQASMLRVVDNEVYFTIEVQPGVLSDNGSQVSLPVYTSTPHTVPVGFVMTVTPQIGENDQVTLNVRPTISRIVDFVDDPNPELARANVISQIPVIQVREIESILKVYSGQIAILGGLMQDTLESDTDGIPGLSRLPGLRNLFSYRSETAVKTELIVFIRPVVIRQPSIDGDLEQYREFLPTNGLGINNFIPEQGSGSAAQTP